MRLSDAIREGIKKRKYQVFGSFRDNKGGTCAIGAANDAGWSWGRQEYPPGFYACPSCKLDTHTTLCFVKGTTENQGIYSYEMVQHLNDDHRWTREAIADWLDTLETPKTDAIDAEFNAVTTAAILSPVVA